MMTTFQYHPDLLARFPATVGGVVLASGMQNGATPAGLSAAYQREQAAVLQRIGDTALSQIDSLAAWRDTLRGFGVDPTQYRSAPEALLRRLTKKGDIPNINLLVDLGNIISIRYALPLAVIDTRALQGALTVRFADGSERFTSLGRDEAEHPAAGEVIFADDSALVVARRWCWRQAAQSAATPETTAAIIVVEAQHAGGHAAIDSALSDLLDLLHEYAGGAFTSGVLDSDTPTIAAGNV